MIYWSEDRKLVEREFIRMGFNKDAKWRISDINKDFELCNTYPRFLIVPSSFKDEDLESVANFRYFRRIPTAVWRHIKNGCFILRSSQPTVGWFGWFRSELDENLIQSYVINTMPSKNEQPNDNNNDADDTQQPNVDINDDLCDQRTLVNDEDEIDDDDDDRRTPQNETTTQKSDRLENLDNDHQNQTNNHNNNLLDTTKVPVVGNGLATHGLPTPTETKTGLSSPPDHEETDKSETSPVQTSPVALNGNGTTSPLENNISTVIETNSTTGTTTTSKMLIIDARSYTAAMANRAKGGGCECSEYYQRCEVHFMNLANIHSIRKSYHAIRSVCEAYSEQSNK